MPGLLFFWKLSLKWQLPWLRVTGSFSTSCIAITSSCKMRALPPCCWKLAARHPTMCALIMRIFTHRPGRYLSSGSDRAYIGPTGIASGKFVCNSREMTRACPNGETGSSQTSIAVS